MSRPRNVRVLSLATEADIDLDEALVSLWDAGLNEIEDADSFVPNRQLRAAKTALGIATEKDAFTVDYWIRRSGLSRAELSERMASLGVIVSSSARKIPKNSLRRFELAFPSRAADPRKIRGPEGVQSCSEELPPVQWPMETSSRPIGHLSEDEIRFVHASLTESFEGTSDPVAPPGVRDDNLLSSAAHRPKTSIGSIDKYATVELAGAALFHSIVQNHAFHNGNKRTGLVSLIVFLDRNDLVLTCTEKELFRLTLLTAQHGLIPSRAIASQLSDREVLKIAEWIRSNTRRVERGELPMKWFKLRQRLREFDCDSAPAVGVGNKLNIVRQVEEPPSRFLKRRRPPRLLRTQVGWAGDGTEADKHTLRKIRRDLELDDKHDIDSATFYRDAHVDAFIIEHRRILQRLAKL